MTRLSLAKEKVRILLLEGIHDNAAADLAAAGYANVERLPGALDEVELLERIAGVHLLGIRSRTQVTAARAGARRPADRRGLLLHRHRPGRARGGAPARRSRSSTPRSRTPAASPSW